MHESQVFTRIVKLDPGQMEWGVDAQVTLIVEFILAILLIIVYWYVMRVYRRETTSNKKNLKFVLLGLLFLLIHFVVDALDTLIYLMETKEDVHVFGIYLGRFRPTYFILNSIDYLTFGVGFLFFGLGIYKWMIQTMQEWEKPPNI